MTYRILAVGDFQGRASRGVQDQTPIHQRRRLEVDRDNLEERLAKFGVSVRLGSGEELALRELDDFEPDAFVRALRSFDELRSVRRRLAQPATFEAAARELGALGEGGGAAASLPESEADAAGARPEGIEMPEGLLSAALEQTAERAQAPADGSSMIESLARQWAAPFVVPAKDPRLPELLAAVDAGMQALARSVLRDPGFHGAEDAWRGLDWLTRALETGPDLKIEVLDATADELRSAGEELRYFGGGGESPAPNVVILLHRFSASEQDMNLLASAAAAAEGAVLVGDAHPELVGAGGDRLGADAGEWGTRVPGGLRDVRGSHGDSVVLVPNRMLMRLAYGKRGGSVEGFQLEEVEGGDPNTAPWLSGAWAVAFALGAAAQGESAQGESALGRAVEIDRLPVCLIDTDDGVEQIPCAEVALGDTALEELRARGFTALRCARGADSIRVGPLVTLSAE